MTYKLNECPINWDLVKVDKIYGSIVNKYKYTVKIRIKDTNTFLDFELSQFPEEKIKELKVDQEGCFTFNTITRKLGRAVFYLKDFNEMVLDDGIEDNNIFFLKGAKITEIREIKNTNFFALVTAVVGDTDGEKFVFRLSRDMKAEISVGDMYTLKYRIFKSKTHVVTGQVLEFKEKNKNIEPFEIYVCQDEQTWFDKEGNARVSLNYTQALDIINIRKL